MSYNFCRLYNESDAILLQDFFQSMDDIPFCAGRDFDRLITAHTGNKVYRFLLFNEANKIIATVAFTHIQSRLFGNRLVSTGYFTEKNLLLQKKQEVDSILLNEIYALAAELSVEYIECKDRIVAEGWSYQENYAHFIKKFDNYSFLETIPRKKRADIYKALGNKSLQFIDSSFEDFYALYSLSQRNLGTPLHEKKFYKTLYDHPSSSVYGITYDNKMIASCMGFNTKKSFIAYYAGAMPMARALHAYDLLYYKLMQKATLEEKYFDFGRSSIQSGGCFYKKNWGFTPQPYSHSFYLLKQKSLPNISPKNRKFSNFVSLWKKIPLKIASLMGPFIMKQIG